MKFLKTTYRFLAVSSFAALLLFVYSTCSKHPDPIAPIIPPVDSGLPDERLYVLNQTDGTIYVYNAVTLARVDSIAAGVKFPHHIEFSPDHTSGYVVNRDPGGKIAKFNLDNDSLMAVADGGVNQFPTAIAVSPGGTVGYVTDFSNAAGHLHRYNLTTMQYIDSAWQSGVKTHDIKISSSGDTIVACNYGSDNLTVVDVSSGNVELVDVNPALPWLSGAPHYGPYGLAISPDEQTLYVACRAGKQVRIMNMNTMVTTDSVVVPGLGTTEAGPCQMRLSPDGSKLYLTTQYDNSIVVINTATKSIVATITSIVPQPFGIYLNDDGSRIYVACANTPSMNGKIYILDGNTNGLLDSIAVGRNSFMVHYHNHAGHH